LIRSSFLLVRHFLGHCASARISRGLARCVGVATILSAVPSAAQTVDSQLWLGGSATVDIAKQVPLSFDTTLRFGDAAHGLYEWARGGMVGVRTDGGTELTGGYQRVTDYSNGDISRREDRLREQASFGIVKLWNGPITGRLRIEERFRHGGDGVGARARLQVRYIEHPFGSARVPSLLVSSEGFFELNDTSWGQQVGLRRMRNAIGLDIPVVKKLHFQAGYMNQYDFGITGKRDAMANIATIVAVARF
jgi:hypothetical protein